MTGKVLCLVGAQYGSEGKGVLAAYLAERFDVHVRTGGPNAGHSFRRSEDVAGLRVTKIWKMRSLPCGWVNQDALLVVGAGAVVDLKVLCKEIEETGTDPERVYVDSRAVLVEEGDRSPGYALKASIGATGEGVGPARVRRLMRGQLPVRTVGDVALREVVGRQSVLPFRVCDTVELLAQARGRGLSILLEGTQGALLDLVHGHWPYVTSSGTTAAQLLADAGLPPGGADVLLVARTFPIRVGGNSGPLPNETSWDEISKRMGRETKEFTTVTGRLRRVAAFELRDVRKAVQLNGPQNLALTFLDYKFPEVEGCWAWRDLSEEARRYVSGLEKTLGVFVKFLGTGGEDFAVIEREGP